MEKGKLIGRGMTADVYEWGHDRVLKLFFEKFGEEWLKYEAGIGSVVHEAGVPSPAVYGLAEIDGRRGIIYERIFGKSILRHIREEPWMIYSYARKLADLHFRINRRPVEKLPTQSERYAYKINGTSAISKEMKSSILKYVKELPDGNSVCHGDLHFGNVILSPGGLVPIDWRNAYRGNPLGDVARTCLMIASPATAFGFPAASQAGLQYTRQLLHWTYLSRYMELSKTRLEDVDRWTLPAAAAKLKDNLPGEQDWLLQIINTRLQLLK